MLKLCSPFIDRYIAHLINYCIEKSCFPTMWKNSIGIPIPKINIPKNFSDLRIISLLPTISKIFEKFISLQIIDYFNTNDLLPDSQCGFRSGRSTVTALATVSNDIISAYDQGLSTALVLLDFSKAFDTISHELLCAKLQYYGFDKQSVFLIWNYFLRRSQTILSNGKFSAELEILSGVPQRSVLGPLLFIIYTADILNKIEKCKVQAYADDIQLYLSFRANDSGSAEAIINGELSKLKDFSKQHLLILNSDKSKVMHFGSKNNLVILKNYLSIKIDDSDLQVSDVARNLGLVFDSEMRFSHHVKNLVSKAFSFLKVIYSNRHYLSSRMNRNLCDIFVLSHFQYCDFIYGPCLTKAERTRIQKVQNSCCRLIYGIRKYEHISHKIKECNWLNMDNRMKLHLANFIHKMRRDPKPPNLLQDLRL
nr:unnamed protein product [Callosobruchus chinensis]